MTSSATQTHFLTWNLLRTHSQVVQIQTSDQELTPPRSCFRVDKTSKPALTFYQIISPNMRYWWHWILLPALALAVEEITSTLWSHLVQAFLDLVMGPLEFLPEAAAVPFAFAWPLIAKPFVEPLIAEPLVWLRTFLAESTDGISILLISMAARVAVPLRFLPRWPLFLYVAK